MRASIARLSSVTVILASLVLVSGCVVIHSEAPKAEPARPELAAGQELHMFGEVAGESDGLAVGSFGLSLTRHTVTPEGHDFDPDVDAAAEQIVFASTRHSGQPNLYVKAVDGVAVTQLTTDPSADIQPAFSPDGTRIALASNRSGNWDIWVVDAHGRQPIQITDSPAQELSPSWSPDGNLLAYCSQPADGGPWELWVAEAESAASRTFIGYGLFPEWSPLGDRIAFQRARERGGRWFSIWTVDIASGEPGLPMEVAFSSDRALILPTWSPDGSRLAYCSVESVVSGDPQDAALAETADLWMVSADGTAPVRLTYGRSANFGPDWANDGRIYFIRSQDQADGIWSLAPVEASVPSEKRRTARAVNAGSDETLVQDESRHGS